jgi:hypothetical protein
LLAGKTVCRHLLGVVRDDACLQERLFAGTWLHAVELYAVVMQDDPCRIVRDAYSNF